MGCICLKYVTEGMLQSKSNVVYMHHADSSNVINNSGKATMMDQQAVTEVTPLLCSAHDHFFCPPPMTCCVCFRFVQSPSSKHGWFSSRKDKDKDDVQSTSETGKTSSPTPERLFKEGYLSKMGKARCGWHLLSPA